MDLKLSIVAIAVFVLSFASAQVVVDQTVSSSNLVIPVGIGPNGVLISANPTSTVSANGALVYSNPTSTAPISPGTLVYANPTNTVSTAPNPLGVLVSAIPTSTAPNSLNILTSAIPASPISTEPISVPPVRIDAYIEITPLTPADNSAFTTTSNALVRFTFLADAIGFMDADYPILCSVNVNSDSGGIIEIDAIFDEDTTNFWYADYEFSEGSYTWIVSCNSNNNVQTWSSPSQTFTVDDTTNNGGNNNGGNNNNNGGGNSRTVAEIEEEGGRRRLTNNDLPLTNLSNTNVPKTPEKNNGVFGITGAVVGVLGEKGALGFGIFLVIVGLAGLFIYNRQRFGMVKSK